MTKRAQVILQCSKGASIRTQRPFGAALSFKASFAQQPCRPQLWQVAATVS